MKNIFLVLFVVICASGCAAVAVLPEADLHQSYAITHNEEVLVDFLSPEGDWTVDTSLADTQAQGKVTFYSTSHHVTSYTVEISLNQVDKPDAAESESYELYDQLTLQLAGDYQKAIEYYLDNNDPEFKYRVMRTLTRTAELSGKIAKVGELTCIEKSFKLPQSLYPYPLVSSEWSDQGTYKRRATTLCAVKKGENIWSLAIQFVTSTPHSDPMVLAEEQDFRTAEEIEIDIRQKIQRTIDSLQLYGFTQ